MYGLPFQYGTREPSYIVLAAFIPHFQCRNNGTHPSSFIVRTTINVQGGIKGLLLGETIRPMLETEDTTHVLPPAFRILQRQIIPAHFNPLPSMLPNDRKRVTRPDIDFHQISRLECLAFPRGSGFDQTEHVPLPLEEVSVDGTRLDQSPQREKTVGRLLSKPSPRPRGFHPGRCGGLPMQLQESTTKPSRSFSSCSTPLLF